MRKFLSLTVTVSGIELNMIAIVDDLSHFGFYESKGYTRHSRKECRQLEKSKDCVFYYNGTLVASRVGKSLLH